METESEDEHIENTEVISPSVTPVQVNTLPVDVPPVRVAINSRQIKPKYVEFHVKCSYSSIIEPINTTNGFGKLSIII
jgi:hypothetical protein